MHATASATILDQVEEGAEPYDRARGAAKLLYIGKQRKERGVWWRGGRGLATLDRSPEV